jgi:DNA-binding NtrC family response regulator
MIVRQNWKTNEKSAEPTHAALHVLLVEPEPETRILLQKAASAVAQVAAHSDFSSARLRLGDAPFDFLVTNLRLEAYNGLHLVYLAAAHGISARSIVYSDRHDVGLAREAQRAGAFYETRECLSVTLTAYLRGTLPLHDRRAPTFQDRRGIFRGGRRCWDSHVAGRCE